MEAAGSASYELSQSLAVAYAMRGEIDLADERFEMPWRARASSESDCISRPPIRSSRPACCSAATRRRSALASDGIEQLREMGEHGYLSTSLIYLADAIVSQDRPDEAETLLKEAEEHAAEDDAVTVIGIRRVRAKIARLQGRLDDAERHAREAVAAGEPTDYLYEKGASHQVLGEILLAKDERDEGLEHLRVGAGPLRTQGRPRPSGRPAELASPRSKPGDRRAAVGNASAARQGPRSARPRPSQT